MDPLLSSLAELGCEVRCEGEDGHFPFTLTAHGFGQDHISIDIGHSSQFLSALLIASTLSSEDFTIQVEGTHGMAYIEMTQKMMKQFKKSPKGFARRLGGMMGNPNAFRGLK